ncbi:MAG: type II CAAX endopeptidase family protein [Acidimicrobiia bacterium]|nr:MAG: type II CAAX endopeptidase family protein [Acidimicrobiia bacterium]
MPPAEAATWKVRHALVAAGVGLGASLAGALLSRGGGITALEVFALILPLQSGATIGVALAMARRGGPIRDRLLLRAQRSDLVGLAVGVGIQILAAAMALVVVETFFGGELPRQEIVEVVATGVGPLEWLLVVLGLVVVGPVAEEIVFRGILVSALIHRGPRFAVIVSSAAFALFHLVDPAAALSVPFLFVLAVVLASERLRTGRLGRPIAIHAGFNLVTVIGVMVSA